MYVKYFKDKSGIRTRYIQWGSPENPPLLLLHGLGSVATSWAELAEKLSENYHVTAVDLPGHGNTTTLAKYSIEGFHDWLGSFLKQIYCHEIKPTAIGHSIGADLLLNFNVLHPHRFKNLILLDGGYLSNEHDFKTSLKISVENAITHYDDFQFNSWSDYLEAEKKGSNRWNDKMEKYSLEKMICDGGKIKLRMDSNTVKAYITCFHENEGAKILNSITVDALLLVSTLPEQANEMRRNAINRIINAKIKPVFIQGATHDLYLDNPDSIDEIIRDWVMER